MTGAAPGTATGNVEAAVVEAGRDCPGPAPTARPWTSATAAARAGDDSRARPGGTRSRRLIATGDVDNAPAVRCADADSAGDVDNAPVDCIVPPVTSPAPTPTPAAPTATPTPVDASALMP